LSRVRRFRKKKFRFEAKRSETASVSHVFRLFRQKKIRKISLVSLCFATIVSLQFKVKRNIRLFRFVICFVSLCFASIFPLHLESKRNLRPCFVVSLRNLFRFALFRFNLFRFDSDQSETYGYFAYSNFPSLHVFTFTYSYIPYIHMHVRSCT